MAAPDTHFARYRAAIGQLATNFPHVHGALSPGVGSRWTARGLWSNTSAPRRNSH